ncbi:hypothetical protein [Microbacterium sp. Ag1]|uniref:hypothetical protein n=1 Tax=Microbacterium sp. Ag1 TaxID=1643443 RepID=UPI0012E0891A|nr:hypothetical protein [Microbacterium sp. Ag1]
MTTDDAFFETLAAINADQERASARLDAVGATGGGVTFVSRDDTETLEAIALFQDAQKRLSALLASEAN